MSTEDDVMRLDGEGLSIRAIAKQLGLSRMKVHRTIAAAIEADAELDLADDEDDLDGDDLALLDAAADDEVVGPFVFVGIVEGDCNRKDDRRYLDARGHPVSSLDLYRYRERLFNTDRTTEYNALTADLECQYAEAGVV